MCVTGCLCVFNVFFAFMNVFISLSSLMCTLVQPGRCPLFNNNIHFKDVYCVHVVRTAGADFTLEEDTEQNMGSISKKNDFISFRDHETIICEQFIAPPAPCCWKGWVTGQMLEESFCFFPPVLISGSDSKSSVLLKYFP